MHVTQRSRVRLSSALNVAYVMGECWCLEASTQAAVAHGQIRLQAAQVG